MAPRESFGLDQFCALAFVARSRSISSSSGITGSNSSLASILHYYYFFTTTPPSPPSASALPLSRRRSLSHTYVRSTTTTTTARRPSHPHPDYQAASNREARNKAALESAEKATISCLYAAAAVATRTLSSPFQSHHSYSTSIIVSISTAVMSIEVQSGSALADALQNVVGPKLAEAGWTSGAVDDNSLTEYIVLMLVNGKTQDQIASELAADLLGLPPDEPSTHEFARWLFEQLAVLNAQINGGIVPQVQQQSAHSGLGLPQGSTGGFGQGETNAPLQDTAMDEDGNDGSNDGPGAGTGAVYVQHGKQTHNTTLMRNSPTGPKSMRNGTSAGNQQQQRGDMGAGGAGQGGRRMLGQLNKAMDRKSQDAASLHRIRAGGNAGRINTHGNREPPKGPRNMNNRMQNALGRGAGVMGAAGMNHQQQQQQQMQPGMNPAMAAGMMSADPQQQMQLLKLLEEQSRMMAQILGPGASQQFTPAINPAFFPNANAQQNQKGKSLFDRVDRKGPRHQNNAFNSKKFASSRNQDAMDTDAATDGAEASTTATGERKDASETACRWNLSCTNPACPFGHQSPAAPAGIVLDLTDKCTYGAACMNKKCVGSHPSPSQKRQHLATTVDCKFYPNCKSYVAPYHVRALY